MVDYNENKCDVGKVFYNQAEIDTYIKTCNERESQYVEDDSCLPLLEYDPNIVHDRYTLRYVLCDVDGEVHISGTHPMWHPEAAACFAIKVYDEEIVEKLSINPDGFTVYMNNTTAPFTGSKDISMARLAFDDEVKARRAAIEGSIIPDEKDRRIHELEEKLLKLESSLIAMSGLSE